MNTYIKITLLAIFVTSSSLYAKDTAYINQQNKYWFQKIISQSHPSILDSLQQTYTLAEKIKYTYGQAETLKNTGLYFYFKKQYDTALQYYTQAVHLLKNQQPNTISISLYLNMGVVYYEQYKYKEAINHYLMARNQAASINDSAMMVKVLINTANVESTIGNLQQAVQTLDEAIKWAGSNNAVSPHLLTTQAALYVKTGDTAKAINNYEKALLLLKDAPFIRLKATTLNNYGNLLYSMGSVAKAASLHNQALEIFEQIGDVEGQLTLLNQLANNAFKEKKYRKALALYKQIAPQTDNFLSLKGTVYKNLMLTYKELGDYKNAFEAAEIANMVKDSMNSMEVRKAFEELKTQNAVQQAEMKAEQIEFKAEKEKLTLSKRIAWLTIGLILALCLAGIVMFLRQRQKWKSEQQKLESIRQKSELEMQLFRTQMNPHFFFNALYSIQNYMLNNNALQSSRYLGKFARLMRAILEWNAQPVVNVAKELSVLEDYLSLEQLRFDDNFSYNIDCSEDIAENYQIPTMILQPFIENAIIHGVSKTSWKGQINIKFEADKKQSYLIVNIDDNGIGLVSSEKQTNKNPDKQSMALMLTKKRLQLLSEQYKNNFYFELKDKKQLNPTDTGVLVNVYLPLTEV